MMCGQERVDSRTRARRILEPCQLLVPAGLVLLYVGHVVPSNVPDGEYDQAGS